ncbi:CmpA/NrtA family ABC transporter substrate-binding protein [Kushneria aurantia]|uniref:CmpA/NrtA family ABC transporter substrate-binding protein n=1 Tax=Kushneria aurantia TaxID=504092 RepID=A0ABV6G620_9GAMM|nr:CmpA/NrtA family ABC transporter substrate-binding protein [Kushneria aurantia]
MSADKTGGNFAPLTLGILPLIDAAPLVAALHGGFFEREGLAVRLKVEGSWASLRDKLQVGAIQGAQLLPLMPLASSLGLDGRTTPMLSALTLSRNGNAITLSREVADAMADYRRCDAGAGAREQALDAARALARLIAARRADGLPPLRLANVYPFSSHRYQLRYWLASAGLDPDRDLSLRVVPPPAMVEQLAEGRIDGYCVGAPWNDIAARRGIGEIVAQGAAIWEGAQEKVFGVCRDWQEAHREAYHALLRALLAACRWLDEDNNHRQQTARWLSDGGYLNVAPEDIEASLDRQRGDIIFFDGVANFPWRSQTAWYAAQMRRWGHLAMDPDRVKAEIEDTLRPDLYRRAAHSMGLDAPIADWRCEGGHGAPWHTEGAHGPLGMLPDRFLDDAIFTP